MQLEKSAANAFRKSWITRQEAQYNHWCKGTVKNQIQLAFRCHWELFQEILFKKSEKILEVGCGRGSISSYFADQGYQCHLLDYSYDILKNASGAFSLVGHTGIFVQGDAHRLPYDDNVFDAVVSIGLLEHFEEIGKIMSEQIRVLAPGGRLLAYVVPERPDNVQKYWRWLNSFLKVVVRNSTQEKTGTKPEIYRNDYNSSVYLEVLKKLPVKDADAFGMYPLPMISHSPEFPFSLLPKPLEYILTLVFRAILQVRKMIYSKNPWICKESFGQAFLVTAVKE